ncbi:hypothetical protein [Rhizobium sp. P007]|uniref:hypothetical protein n=1 Tax=Rhizobium sp. P007 TaxID=285908 RepID=UPI0011593810|nr:hypothetical protein [Rhizobium sp. P007]CAD7025081.1 hypothetical protein RP007_00579 [Rhizobium sp. P007]
MRRYHVLTAEQFIAQGTSPGAILSIASTQKDRVLRSQLEDTARVVALETCQPLQIPGAANDNRVRRLARSGRAAV